ncbi:MAG TPA: hypothetical protein PKN29_00355 [Candidatus Ozemobacteraceae bacterium]|nr:hypothetical protein [Candidatus Ozemobacteraceae bacterium]
MSDRKNGSGVRVHFGLLAVALLFTVLTGCRSSYNYATFRAQAEAALSGNKVKKAKELYSVIYQHENKAETPLPERTTWAFYRLGVIAEVMGDVQLAKGYYWGDKIDEGFYQVNPAVEWLAEAGWQNLDEGNPPRTLDEILELEKSGQKKTVQTVEKKKREVVIPADRAMPVQAPVAGDKPYSRTFQRSLTPPRPGAPEPFRVFY